MKYAWVLLIGGFVVGVMSYAQLAQAPTVVKVAVVEGAYISPPINLGACIPAAFTFPQMVPDGNLTFQSSTDGVTYYDVYDDSNKELVVSTGTGSPRTIVLGQISWEFAHRIKIRVGTTNTPITMQQTLPIDISTTCRH